VSQQQEKRKKAISSDSEDECKELVHIVLPRCSINGDKNAMDSFLQHEDDHPGFEEFHVLGNGTVRKTTCCCSDGDRSLLPDKKLPQASIIKVLPSNKQTEGRV
jgi:hypothetical protein